MLVYRYEHPKDKRGPYTSTRDRTLAIVIANRHNEYQYTTHPGPWRDCGVELYWDSRICGMTSPEGLRKWFWGFNERIKKAGFVQKVYRVPEGRARVSARTGQVVFDRNHAEVVG